MHSRILNVILAANRTGCIGRDRGLPWKIPSDLARFKRLTMGGTLIVGRNTAESLPKLSGREMLIVSRKPSSDPRSCRSLQEAIDRGIETNKPLFVIGGASIYEEIFRDHNLPMIDNVYYSLVDGEHEGDTYVNFPTHKFVIISEEPSVSHVFYTLRPEEQGEQLYLGLLRKLLEGEECRGRNGKTLQVFGDTSLRFDLRSGFPLLTTKKMFFRGIIEELLFFLRGDTDTRILEEKRVNIWKGNTSREFLDLTGKDSRQEGVMGPMYGYQWRNFNAEYDESAAGPAEPGFDQLQNVVNTIQSDPGSRRILMTTYNPLQVDQGVLPPCHSIILQFSVSPPFLDMTCYNRSQDTFLGMPFNIASSSLLLAIVARITGLTPRYFTLYGGCVHLYEQHLEAAKEQISRVPYKFPILEMPRIESIEDIAHLKACDFQIERYISHPKISAPMAV